MPEQSGSIRQGVIVMAIATFHRRQVLLQLRPAGRDRGGRYWTR
jgi:hypothetical protein